MNGRYYGWIAGGLFIAGLLICSSYAVEPIKQGGEVNEKMVAEAKKALEATQAMNAASRASVEDIYRWSRRVVEADHFSSQAIKDHTALMQDLHARTVAKGKVGVEGGEDNILHATEYYLAEAEGFARQ